MIDRLCWCWVASSLLTALLATGFPLSAADTAKKAGAPTEAVALPRPADVQALAVYPTKVALKGSDDALQLILTATLAGGKQQDLTADAQYEIADSKIARVTSAGQVIPLTNGTTTATVTFGGKKVTVPVTTEKVGENLPINFANQITPIFTKLGCNSGGCHGKASGQNGFRLSLLGFEPDLDYMTIVKEGRGRRLFPAAPEQSLLLQKAAGVVAHGGGKRLEVNSDEYRLIRRWVASNTPYGKDTDPTVTKITVYPEHRIMARNNKQQFAVYAHYSDDSVEDVTRRAQYESNDTEVATVDGNALVHSLSLSGEAAVMARYQGQVAVFRATVPLGLPIPAYTFEPKTVVDKATQKKWQELGIVPSETCTDEVFIRRAALDITGTLPTPKQVTEFVNDSDPQKREKLVDRLLDSPEYAYWFANKWADILRVKRGNQAARAYGTFSFHTWIREAIATDKPYDEFTREIIVAIGDETKAPSTVWYKDLTTADQFVDNMSQVFLGTRLQCAQCHHHPYEKWSQDDYWGLAAFFGRVARKNVPVPGVSAQNQQTQRQVLFVRPTGNVVNKRTGQPAPIKPLDSEPLQIAGDDDPRHHLVNWMVDAKNPFFAKTVANRYWAHFFGRGIIDPLDDMRVTNPPSNPELLDALAKDLVDNKYSLKSLIRTICKSRTYQLSAIPNDYNKHDKQANARYYPKRLGAEVLFDALCQVTGSPTAFPGLPADAHAPRRAIMLPDESFQSYFLDVFGRPQRISACECERVNEANLAQALHLLNSDEVQTKLNRAGGRADQLAKDTRPETEKVEELFLWAWGRKPNEKQLATALENLQQNGTNKKAAYENILWALINSKAFLFNQ